MMLFLIAGAWVTGLFVVIAAVTMVAMATGPGTRTGSSAAAQNALAGAGRPAGNSKAGGDSRIAGDGQAGQDHDGHGQAGHGRPGHRKPGRSPIRNGGATGARPALAGPWAPARIHAVYVGTGSADTSQFTIGGNGTWELAWSYRCTGPGTKSSFTVSQDGLSGTAGPHIARLSSAGQGVTWARRDSGTHYLAIRTQCRWRLTVTSHP